MNNINLLLSFVLLILLVFKVNELSSQEYDNIIEKTLRDSTFTWRTITANKIRIYYQKDSFTERHRMMILRSITTAIEEVLDTLAESDRNSVLNVFYLESREEMKRITGRPYSGFSDWTTNSIFIVLNPEWRSFEKHEFAHVVTMGLWGSPNVSAQWMIEGIAIHCDGWCRQYTVDEIAFYFLSKDQLPTLQELFDNFTSLGEIRAGISDASFIGFIGNRLGVRELPNLWSKGVGNLQELLGENLNQLENSWKLYIKRNARKNIQVDLDTINKLGCG